MSFYDWLMNQTERDDPIGDLANDAQGDQTAPKDATVEQWRAYLVHHPGACWQARQALDEAIEEYQA